MKGKKSSFYSFKVKSKQVAIMAKRILEDLKSEHYQIVFKYDEDESQLRKKIKLENDIIIDKIKEHYEDIDISEHEVQKFLLIFHTLMETVNSEESLEETDGVNTDTFVLIISKSSDLLRENIDSLKLPAILKSALKKVKTYSTSKNQKKMPNVQLRPRRLKINCPTQKRRSKEKWCGSKTNGSQKKSNLSRCKRKTKVLNFSIAHH